MDDRSNKNNFIYMGISRNMLITLTGIT